MLQIVRSHLFFLFFGQKSTECDEKKNPFFAVFENKNLVILEFRKDFIVCSGAAYRQRVKVLRCSGFL